MSEISRRFASYRRSQSRLGVRNFVGLAARAGLIEGPTPAVGVESVKAFLRRPGRLECDDGSWTDYRLTKNADGSYTKTPEQIPPKTDQPQLYRRDAVRHRLLPVLARLPGDFFARITLDRDLRIAVTAAPQGLWTGPSDQIDAGTHGNRTFRLLDLNTRLETDAYRVLFGRVLIEVAPPDAFAGIVIHELCHVYLGHGGNDATDDDAMIQQREDEAVALACQLGFPTETATYLEFYEREFEVGGIMGRLPVTAR